MAMESVIKSTTFSGLKRVALGLLLLLSACAEPASKEQYLKRFERFVADVEEHAEKFNKNDWRWADERFDRYCFRYYDRFSDGLTLQEQLQVTGLKLRYQAMKDQRGFPAFFDKYLKRDLKKMEGEAREYVKKDLDKDIDKVVKGAREIGDSAVKVLEDVLNELKKKKDN